MLFGSDAGGLEAARVFLKTRARNDGERGKRCGLAGQSGPKSFAAAFLNILPENVLLCPILVVVWQWWRKLQGQRLESREDGKYKAHNQEKFRPQRGGVNCKDRD